MCGIFGYIHREPFNDGNVCLSAIQHRGPDDTRSFHNDHIFLGHTRLAIIDVSHAIQPMTSVDGRFTLAYNGEIYNFKELRRQLEHSGCQFTTDSDTEVLLQAFIQYRQNIFPKLEGMYAFAIWDNQTRELFLARDPLGIKPLYFMHSHNGFAFASEIKALKPIMESKSMDILSLKDYLRFGYVSPGHTFYQHIKELVPGECLTLKDHKYHTHRHFNISSHFPETNTSLSTIESLINRSVQNQLVADVPFGIFLSGGMDSSYILSQMYRHIGPGIPSFTIGFKENGYDETVAAASIASYYQSNHHPFILSEKDFLESMDEWLRHTDQPQSDPSIVATYFLSKGASKHVKMVLSGEGSDELFFGYKRYRALLWRTRLSRTPMRLNPFDKESPIKTIRILAKFFSGLSQSMPESYYSWISTGESWDTLFRIPSTTSYEPSRVDMGLIDVFEKFSPLKAAQIFDLTYYLPSQLLKKVDMASMRYGLEVRVPFLNEQLVTHCLSLPAQGQVSLFAQKKLFKKILLQNLPERLVGKRKKGFSIPIDIWFRQQLKLKFQHQVLSCLHPALAEIFDPQKMESLFQQHLRKQVNVGKTLWTILVLNLWLHQQDA